MFFAALLLALLQVANPSTPQAPVFKSAPGQKVNVVSTVKHFNFYPLTRTIPLPWSRLPLPKDKIPKGNNLLSTFSSPSSKIAAIQKDPAGKLKEFGTPSKQAWQAFNGKDGPGAIVFFEYEKKLPDNAKEILSQLIFGKKTPPEPKQGGPMEQFLVNDHTVILWAFKKDDSQVRQAHQDMIFSLISEMATATQASKPNK